MLEGLDIIIGILIAVMLIGNGLLDIRKKEISIGLCLVTALTGLALILMAGNRSLMHIGMGLIPGLFMILVALLSRGRVGMGDGLVILALGLLWGFEATFAALFTGMAILALISIIMLASKRWKPSTSLPFIPFLCGASGLVALCMGSGF